MNSTALQADRVDMNGCMPGDPDYNPMNTKRANDKHAARAAAEAAQKALVKKWTHHRYALSVLDGLDERWASELRESIERRNAERSPSTKPPDLYFSGKSAVEHGATDSQMSALPVLSNDEIAELIDDAEILRSRRRDRIRSQADNQRAAEAAAGLSIPDRLDLASFIPPDTLWVVDGLIPAGASLGLFAERKAGKTATMVELSHSLLTGEKFLGRFDTCLPKDARVALLDTEMTETMLHDEYTRYGVPFDRLDVWALRGKSGLLDFRHELNRARWQEQIAPGSFIIVDCLYTILAALTIDENSAQVADVIEGIKTLAVECKAAGWCVVHHVGKDSTKGARGHSSIEGAVDTVAWLHLDGPLGAETLRTFEAVGRHDVNVPLAQIVRGGDRRLTLGDTTPQRDRRQGRNRTDDDRAYALIAANPGLSVNALWKLPAEAKRGLSRDRLRGAVERLDLTDQIVNTGTAKSPQWCAGARDSDPFGSSAPLTDVQVRG